MTDRLDDEAELIWLGRAASAPDAWRARATNAAGLLGAAGAVSLAGVLFGDLSSRQEAVRWLATMAAILYGLGVITYLVASVRRPPKRDKNATNFRDELLDYVEDEATPIRRLVYGGTALASSAVVLTGLAIAVAVNSGSEREGLIQILRTPDAKGLGDVCPQLLNPFPALARDLEGASVEIEPRIDGCAVASFVTQESSFVFLKLDDG